ncbi:MAG: prolyl oligopeptidase family serine peptidase [Candidatus Latescibacterota bacterium]
MIPLNYFRLNYFRRALAIMTVAWLTFQTGIIAADADLPALDEPIVVADWLTVGPFSVGTREGYIDFLTAQGGEREIRPEAGMEHLTLLAEGGRVRWRSAELEEDKVNLTYEGVNWELLGQSDGQAGQRCVGYGYAEFASDRDQRALVMAERIGTFWLNGDPYYGDGYGHEFVKVPVVLKEGINRVLVKVGRSRPWFSFRVLPVKGDLTINDRDLTTPDIRVGERLDGWIGVPVLNTTTEQAKDVMVMVTGELFEPTETVLPNLEPLTMEKVPVPIRIREHVEPAEISADTVYATVSIVCDGVQDEQQIPIGIRRKDEPYRVTFLSGMDESAQHFSVRPPTDFDPEQTYALILSLHGASVPSDGQVTSYAPKDWAFVVAPTNRRRFGFDWQDWGRRDVLEVLEQMQARYRIDPNRIYLTGHSMGGHGVWHVGLHHADRFAAMAPSAGWNSFPLYAPLYLRKDYMYAPPSLRSIWERAIREDRTEAFMENARNVPAFVLHGSDDDDVPVTHARRAVEMLTGLDYEVFYHEKPGKGHWWDEGDLPGTACVDYPEMMAFFKERARNPYPKHVVFVTTDLGVNDRLYWVQVDQLKLLYEDARIEAEVGNDDVVRVTAKNISGFTLHLTDALVAAERVTVQVNGSRMGDFRLVTTDGPGGNPQTRIRDPKSYEPLSFHLHKDGTFRAGPLRSQRFEKTPAQYGPIKAAYFSPFLFVYGTAGDAQETALNLHLARIGAQQWWWRANGHVRVVPDSEVDARMIEHYNLILFGGPGSNTLMAQIAGKLPISVRAGSITVEDRKMEGPGWAVRMIYPNPLNRKRFVLVNAGTDVEGMRLTEVLGTMHSAAGLPDYIIYNREIKTKGWGGVTAAGFFDQTWRLDRSLGEW